MPAKNFSIKYQDHFKLYVLQKDSILFENQLNKYEIPFYVNHKEQPFIEGGIRYFVRSKDSASIDQITSKYGISATIESNPITDHDDSQRGFKVWLFVFGGIILIGLLVILIESMVG